MRLLSRDEKVRIPTSCTVRVTDSKGCVGGIRTSRVRSLEWDEVGATGVSEIWCCPLFCPHSVPGVHRGFSPSREGG